MEFATPDKVTKKTRGSPGPVPTSAENLIPQKGKKRRGKPNTINTDDRVQKLMERAEKLEQQYERFTKDRISKVQKLVTTLVVPETTEDRVKKLREDRDDSHSQLLQLHDKISTLEREKIMLKYGGGTPELLSNCEIRIKEVRATIESIEERREETKRKLNDIENETQQRKQREKIERKQREKLKEKAEREAKEKTKREAREKAEHKARIAKEAAENAEREAREKAEREAKEKAEHEAKVAKEAAEKAEREAREKADHEAKVAKEAAENAEREAREKAEHEAKVAKEEAEKAEREAREKADHEAKAAAEKSEREAREKAEHEAKVAKEVAEKAEREAREKSEHEAKVAKEVAEKAEREAREKSEQTASFPRTRNHLLFCFFETENNQQVKKTGHNAVKYAWARRLARVKIKNFVGRERRMGGILKNTKDEDEEAMWPGDNI